ncbi:HIT family protein [Patescibacteria group bacterium]|nr:HIT family protein [Patescibacteria group bacterium]
MTTIFEKIIAREVPADIIYEDDTVLVFLDIKPVHLGHALVVPKVPFVNIFDGDSEVLAHMMKVATQVGQRQQTVLGAHGVNFIMNNGAAAGQEVFHAHLHVIPRFMGDKVFTPPTHENLTPEEITAVAARLQM